VPKRVSNPPNPWTSTEVDWLDDPPKAELHVYEEDARSVLTRNDSPDLPFRWSLNPYRGCQHACAYCYARPDHQYLGWGAGTDFDTRIVVKRNAPEVLRRELRKPSWRGELVLFSGDTDCYQPLEAGYALTRRCLQECLAAHNPVSVITKGALVRRDVDVLAALARDRLAGVFVSIAFASDDVAHRIEPSVPPPSRRFETIRALADAGNPVGVAVAPVIPGLSDAEIPEILARARAAGARRAFLTMLRLSREVLPVFADRLEAAFPDRAARVLGAVARIRGGKLSESAFGRRMAGQGPRWDAIAQLFALHCRRLGLATSEGPEQPVPRPRGPRQGELF
jgi:DNA repair photolyase